MTKYVEIPVWYTIPSMQANLPCAWFVTLTLKFVTQSLNKIPWQFSEHDSDANAEEGIEMNTQFRILSQLIQELQKGIGKERQQKRTVESMWCGYILSQTLQRHVFCHLVRSSEKVGCATLS